VGKYQAVCGMESPKYSGRSTVALVDFCCNDVLNLGIFCYNAMVRCYCRYRSLRLCRFCIHLL